MFSSSRLALHLTSTLHEPPIDERIVNKGFEYGDDRLLVRAHDTHRVLRRDLEGAFDARDLRDNRQWERMGREKRDAPPSPT